VRTVGVIQARMASTRLPGKSLEPLAGRPLVLWTVAAMQAVPELANLVVAITEERSDDPLAAALEGRVSVHRGPVHDVLRRVQDAVAPFRPDLVVRETADNPFVDPAVVSAQVTRCIEGGFDYVGTAGWPLGIAAEVARGAALAEADREAAEPAEREHVTPFLYSHPERFRVGSLSPTMPLPSGRFTVDTAEDLAFVRAIAERLGRERASVARLRAIVEAEPELVAINAGVRQKTWQEAEVG